jgi:hypothetical protein
MNNTIITLPFDKAVEVTSSIPMIITYGLIWFIPLFIYLLWGATANSRTADGRVLQSKVISNANFWIGFIIFGLVQLGLFVLAVFPVWLMLFE